jgi:hypothetical protein
MDDMTYVKSDAQPQEAEDVNGQTAVVKYPSGGRPSIADSPELQSEYANIYISYTVDGLNEAEIALERGISRAKVKKALAWCRDASLPYADEENLIDYINTCNSRIQAIRQHEKRIWQDIDTETDRLNNWQTADEEARKLLPKPNVKYRTSLRIMVLEYGSIAHKWLITKVKCQLMLNSIRTREQEYMPSQKKPTPPEPMRMSDEDKRAIAEIVERAERRKALENR